MLGIDGSERMLARARATTIEPAIQYLLADLEQLELPPAAFDFAYSSLALHYIENLDRLFATVTRALVGGGRFVFSVEHPIYTAPSRPGWAVHADGHKTWPIDQYLFEGPRHTDWLTGGVVKQHRTLTTYANLLLRHGFAIAHLEEWAPTAAQIAACPELAEELERPMFLILAGRK